MATKNTNLPPLFKNNSNMNGYRILREKIDPSKTKVEHKKETIKDKFGDQVRQYTSLLTMMKEVSN